MDKFVDYLKTAKYVKVPYDDIWEIRKLTGFIPQPNMCHDNVEALVFLAAKTKCPYPITAVPGWWVIHGGKAGTRPGLKKVIDHYLHTVANINGMLIDITPRLMSFRELGFIPFPFSTFDFASEMMRPDPVILMEQEKSGTKTWIRT